MKLRKARAAAPTLEGYEPYRPARWLPGRHAMTLWGRVVRRGPWVELRRETWTTPDGDTLAMDRMDGPADTPLLLVLHGLEGCSRSLYVQGVLHGAQSHGWRGVAMNFRSCASPPGRPRGEWVPNRAPRMYHSGETEDLDWVVERLIETEPGAPILIVGVSLGANVMLKWLGERGDAVPPAVRGSAAISTPFDLALGSRVLLSGLGPMYTRFFLKTLKEKAVEFDRRWPGIIDVEAVRRARSFREFDDAVVAPIHGFMNSADYYARSSSLERLGDIKVPTLLVSAADDPFQPGIVFPRVRERASGALTCLFTNRGGHAGFVTGPPWAPRKWDEGVAIEFLARQLAAPAPLRADPLSH